MRFIASDSLAAVSSKVSNSGNRNKIINGGMSVWQRGTSFSDPANMTGYTADRWVAVWGTAGRTFSQQAGFDNARYCLRVQRNSGSTGVGNSGIATFFETVNSIPLQGKTVTLSFSARCGANYSAASSQISAYVFTGTGTDQSASTWYSPGWTGSSQIIGQGVTLTTTSQRFTLTGVVASNATQIAVYFIGVPTGTAGAADYWEITNVQLEEGAVATPFEFEDYQTTMVKCMRYFQVLAPSYGQANTSTQVVASHVFHVPMRTSPSVGSTGVLYVTDGYAADILQSATLVSIVGGTRVSPQGAHVFYGNYTGLTVGRMYCANFVNSNNVTFSAEL